MPDLSSDAPNDKRQLAAILAADVVGYSKMMEAQERETLKRVRDLRDGLIQPNVAEHHGRIFKTMGDGFLVEFSSVVDAVHCAVDIQRKMASRNLDLPEAQRLPLMRHSSSTR
jgi:adenylate cyclase